MKRYLGAVGHYEADMSAYKIPRCPKCQASNPRALASCPACGEPAPVTTDFQHVDAVTPDDLIPWYAAVLLAIGVWLKRLHDYLSRSDP